MMRAYLEAIASNEFIQGNTQKIRERVLREMEGKDASDLRRENQFESFETVVRLLLKDKFKVEFSLPEGLWSPSLMRKPVPYILTSTEDGTAKQFET